MTTPRNAIHMSNFVQFSNLLEIRKSNAKVLILGSYRALKPCEIGDFCRERLRRLKAFLKARGFDNTGLVEDWIDENKIPAEVFDEHFREKSFYYIDNWAEILIFVFFKEADNISVTREWSHMIESTSEKCKCSVILRHEDLDLGSLVRGDIGVERVREYSFKDEDELNEFAFSGCFNVLYSLESSKRTAE